MTTMVAIGKVEYRMHNRFVGLYRDGVIFAKVYAEKLYSLNDQGIFVKINKEENIEDQLKQSYNIALVVE